MKKIILSLAMLLLLTAPCSLSQTVNEDGQILSDASGLKAGDRIILPDGAMYAMVQKDELTARLDEILPEISLGEIPKKLYRYKRIGVYGTDLDTKDIRDALAQYGCVSLSREEGLTSEQKAQKLSYSGASLLMEVKSVPGSEIRLRALRTVSQREAVLLGRLAMSKGSIDCLIIQNPPAGQTVLQPRLILEIGQDAEKSQALKAAGDIGQTLFGQVMQPDGSAQAGIYIAPVCLGLIFICFIWSFFRP